MKRTMSGIFKESQLWVCFVATKVNALTSSGGTVKLALSSLKISHFWNLWCKLFEIFSWHLNLGKDLDLNYMEINKTNNPQSCAAETGRNSDSLMWC